MSAPAKQPDFGGRMPRRTFLAGAGGLALSAALAALPEALVRRGWLDEAVAIQLDLTRDTINGLVSFVAPGEDEYSRAQGAATAGPGGIAAGATTAMIETLDRAVPVPVIGAATGTTLPASAAVAVLLNNYALQLNPAASRGNFLSPFARLSWAEKGEVFRRFESDPVWDDGFVRNLASVLPSFAALISFSEVGVFENGKLTGTPAGWGITGYAGPSDGWKEFKGYYRGRRAAVDAHRFVRSSHRRRGPRPRRRPLA